MREKKITKNCLISKFVQKICTTLSFKFPIMWENTLQKYVNKNIFCVLYVEKLSKVFFEKKNSTSLPKRKK